jgi:hypothetical protein
MGNDDGRPPEPASPRAAAGRRHILAGLLGTALGGSRGLPWREEATAMTPPEPNRSQDLLDDALERLTGCGPEFGGGLANHGPMAAEALVTLGRAEDVARWVDAYRRRLGRPLARREPIPAADWRAALGRFERAADWSAFFAARLQEGPWTDVLDTWSARLAPGFIGAATHGAIRTGHAARALAARDTPSRRRELAEGLAYWAARYQELPEAKGPARTGVLPSRALVEVPLLPGERRGRGGLILDRLEGLDGFAPFASVADLVDTGGGASAFLSDLTAAFAGVYLEQARANPRNVIAFIHSVTGPSAVRLLLPHVSSVTARTLLRYSWLAAAALLSGLREPASSVSPAAPPGPATLVDASVATGDEHAIKFTEACLREHAVSPDRVYLAAARDATSRLA